MKFNFNILKYQLPAMSWAIFIWVLCTTGNTDFVSQDLLGIATDKLGHAFVFSVLVYFIMLGLIKTWRFSFLLRKIRIIAFLIALIYAIFIELIQHYFTVDRTADYWDVVADIVGAGCGWLMFHSVYGNLKYMDKI